MKKNLLLLALLGSAATAAQAQITEASIVKPGTVAVGGGIGYSRYSNTRQNGGSSTQASQEQFNFSPSIGYFVANNTVVGVNMLYTNTDNNFSNITPGTVQADLSPGNTLRLGAFAGYTTMLSDQFGVIGTLNGGYQHYRTEGDSSNGSVVEYKASGYYVAITPGIIYWPVRKFSVSATIGSLEFSHLNYDYPTNIGAAPAGYQNTSNDFGARFGLNQFLLSATFFIGRPD